MSINNLYPDISPSLLLDFANVKKLDPRITFARASTGAYYDGQTVTKAEENLLAYSQEFDSASWYKLGITVSSNNAVAPDGTTTAETLTYSTGGTQQLIRRGDLTFVAGVTYTISIFARSVSGNTTLSLDLTNYISTGFTLTSSWDRYVWTITPATSYTWLDIQTGGPAVIEIWGAQLEQRDTVTAYTPTTTQPITNYIPTLLTAPANTARFDHDPVTGESLGLLMEEQRTNLVTYSEQFDNASWSKTSAGTGVDAVVTQNDAVAPDGTLTADRVDFNRGAGNTVSDQSNIIIDVGTVSVIQYAGTVYLKAATPADVGKEIAVRHVGVSGYGVFTLTSLWQRAERVETGIAGTRSFEISTRGTVSADNQVSVHIWGAQLEAGAFPTSYIKTQASQVTRSADSASMTGANFSDWYRQGEGSLYAEGKYFHNYPAGPYPRILELRGDGNRNSIEFLTFGGNIISGIFYNNGQYFIYSSAIYDYYKMCVGYELNNVYASVNGDISSVDNSVLIPTVNSLYLGISGFNGRIKKIAYYPQRISNEQIQALTKD